MEIPEQGAVAEPQDEASKRRIIKDSSGYFWAVGRRKASTARVRVRPGSGGIVINGRELKEYFPDETWTRAVVKPLVALEREKSYDIIARVKGGGLTGQSEAIALGIARAIWAQDPEAYPVLKAAGLMTRDARIKERKKYGLAGARAAFQFSKR